MYNMMQLIDIVGQKFNYLTVVSLYSRCTKQKRAQWNCICDCGKACIVVGERLKNGKVKSCGCYRRVSRLKNTHGLFSKNKRLYKIWAGMMFRCNNIKHEAAKYYINKGIKVCEEWRDAKVFMDWALNNGYDTELTIDRIDYNGNYEPSNCRWVLQKIQKQNTSKTLGEQKVREIKNQINNGISADKLALQYKVNRSLVFRIKSGETYSNITI